VGLLLFKAPLAAPKTDQFSLLLGYNCACFGMKYVCLIEVREGLRTTYCLFLLMILCFDFGCKFLPFP
jgi:hypothetical protein